MGPIRASALRICLECQRGGHWEPLGDHLGDGEGGVHVGEGPGAPWNSCRILPSPGEDEQEFDPGDPGSPCWIRAVPAPCSVQVSMGSSLFPAGIILWDVGPVALSLLHSPVSFPGAAVSPFLAALPGSWRVPSSSSRSWARLRVLPGCLEHPRSPRGHSCGTGAGAAPAACPGLPG